MHLYRKLLSPDPPSMYHEKTEILKMLGGPGDKIHGVYTTGMLLCKLSLKKGDLCGIVDGEHGRIQLSCRGGEVHNHSAFLLKQLRKQDLSHL